MPDALVIHQDGKICYANPATVRIFGVKSSEVLIGKSVFDFVHADSLELVKERIQKVQVTGEPASIIEEKLVRPDGGLVQAAVTGSLITYAGKPAIQVIICDKTSARQSELQFCTFFEQSPLSMQVIGRDGRTLMVNKAWEKLWGVDLATLGDFNVLEDEQLHAKGVTQYLERAFTGEAVEIPAIFFDPGESRRAPERAQACWIRAFAFPIFDAGGEVIKIVLEHEDITERRQAEQEIIKLTRAVEQSPSSVIITDPEGAIEFVNEAFTAVTGYSREEALGNNPRLLKSGLVSPEVYEQLWQTITSGQTWRGELCNRRKDGSLYWDFISISPVRNERGEISQFVGVQTDITERKQMEKALRESHQQLQAILDNSTTVIYLKDTGGKYILINRRYEELFHISKEEIIGKTDFDIFPKDKADAFRENDLKVLNAKAPVEFEEYVPHEDGEHSYISIKFPLFDAKGESYGVCGISTDITERKELYSRLQRSEEKYRDVFENANDAIFIIDPETKRFLDVNEHATRHTGYSKEELLKLTIDDIDAPEAARRNEAIIQNLMKTAGVVFEHAHRRKDSREIPVEISAKVINYGNRRVFQAIVRDISERKQMENAIRESEARFRTLVEQSPLAIQVVAPSGEIIRVNKAWEELWGVPLEALANYNILKDQQLIDKGVMPYIEKAMAGEVAEVPEVYYDREATPEVSGGKGALWVRTFIYPVKNQSGAVFEVAFVQEDISESKQAKKALQEQMQKLQRFNKLAVGREMRMIELKQEKRTGA
jgi:PAS domain S-box-containing protein